MRPHIAIVTLCAGTSASSLEAQARPGVHLLPRPSAVSHFPLGRVSGMQELPDGRVLLNDIMRHQILIAESSLLTASVVVDSMSGQPSYGSRPAGLVPYGRDSALFVNGSALSMLLIGPDGKRGRIAAIPRPEDATILGSNIFGRPRADPRGRLVYRLVTRPSFATAGGGPPRLIDPPDSAAIVRVALAERRVDTVAFFKIRQDKTTQGRDANGNLVVTTEINPFPIIDAWTVLPDGTVAVVRGIDLHVDWYDVDGKRTSTPKIPYEWERIEDDQRSALVDSARTFDEQNRRGVAGMSGDARIIQPTRVYVSPDRLPDYRPALVDNGVLADESGNLWIQTTQRRPSIGGPVYYVVDRAGALVDRVQLPAGRVLVGFGRNTVFLFAADGAAGQLERVQRM